MSRRLLYIFVVVSVLALTLVAANNPAKKTPVYITRSSGEVTIGPNQVGIARFGWGACSKGMEQDFMDHFVIELKLYRGSTLLQTVSTDQGYWIQNAVDPNPICLHINEPQIAYWQFDDLNIKKPGTYTLSFHPEWTAPLADGGDYDQNGFVDVFPPTVVTPQEVTINVLP